MKKSNFLRLNSKNIVTFLEDLFERRGNEEYLGEPVTMAQHMLQGAKIAEQKGESDITIVATLLHDIGHFTSEFGMFNMSDTSDKFHENSGAEILKRFFPKLVTDCVQFHVAAKRYLCATDPSYMNRLSKASIHSLHLQGGPMNTTEIIEFGKNPYLNEILKVRLFDDAGKDPEMKTPPFSYYAPRVQHIVDQHVTTLEN
jgi:predicted HD phosphohydrolase